MNYYIYLTTNLITGKQYVGERSTNKIPEEDKYIGSGKLFKIKVKEYSRNNFKKQIINKSFTSKQEAFNAQEKYIIQYNTLVPNGYNISPKGGHGCKDCWSQESKNKMIGHPNWLRKQTVESRLKISLNNAKPMSGKHHTEKSKEKNRQTHIGKIPWNKNIKGKQIAWNKGKIGVSKKTSEKMINAHTGKLHPNNRKTGFKYKKSIVL